MTWQPYELHTHTIHSDGRHTLLEMATEAKRLGLSGIALTDHNTMSGLVDAGEVMEKVDINIINGLEWTTFYGHMVTLGLKSYADWRDLGPDDIHKGLKRIHGQGAIAGIAHPFSLGNPICTGCYWEYTIDNWNEIDYFEVWNGPFPSVKNENKLAYQMWTDLLNKGYRIPATSGRDWHESKPEDKIIASTFLKFPNTAQMNNVTDNVLNAIKKGAVSVSMGPLLLMSIEVDGEKYSIGDEFSVNDNSELQGKLTITLDLSVRKGSWIIQEQDFKLKIIGNNGVVSESKLSNNKTEVSFVVNLKDHTWVRSELYGVIDKVHTLIAFTNPIYINR